MRVVGFIQAAENSRKRDHNNPPGGSAAQPPGAGARKQPKTWLLHYFTTVNAHYFATINATSAQRRAKLQAINQTEDDDMTDIDDARLEAVRSFREITTCYLNFAKEAGSPTVRGARLRLAAKFEREAAALEAASQSATSEPGASGCGGPPPSSKKCASTRTVIFHRQGSGYHVGP